MAGGLFFVCAAAVFADGPVTNRTAEGVVTYEAFGAVGDGVADDLPAICAAHAHANQHGLRVKSNPQATYQLGRRALTAVIAAAILAPRQPSAFQVARSAVNPAAPVGSCPAIVRK